MIDADELQKIEAAEEDRAFRESGLFSAILEVRHAAIAFIERKPGRSRCAHCRIRRVLYRVGIRTPIRSPEFTEARCAPCWGITPDAA